jgi:hypothetical protein
MINIITKVLILFLLSSCIFASNYHISGKLIKIYLTKDVVVEGPPGAFVKVLTWTTIEKNRDLCLFFKAPIKDIKGSLVLIENKDCVIGNLKSIKIINSDVSRLTLLSSESSYELQTQNEIIRFTFPFATEWPLFSLKENEVGTTQDGVYCRRFDEKCRLVAKQSCVKCESNFFTSSLNRFCSNQSQRRCGRISCGRKNEIACLGSLSKKKNIDCEEAKQHVFCDKGRLAYCEPSGRLICK